MKDYYKEKIRTLTTLRANLFTCVIVLTGGIVGLFFSNIKISIIVTFALIGGYLDMTFIVNMISIHNDINKTLEDLKYECR